MTVRVEDILALIAKEKVVDHVSSLRSDLSLPAQGVDSLSMFQIYLLVEQRFAIKIDDDDVPHLSTLCEIADYVNERLASR